MDTTTTLIAALQAIARAPTLEAWQQTVLQALLDCAPAQRACIILEQEGCLVVAAEGFSPCHITAQVNRPLDEVREDEQQGPQHEQQREPQDEPVAAIERTALQGGAYVLAVHHTTLYVPLRDEQQPTSVGVLSLERDATAPPFSSESIEAVETLASYATIALAHIHRYEAMQHQLDQRKRAEHTLLAIAEGTAAVTGGDFFRSFANYLATAFQVQYAFIAECTDSAMTRVRTLALVKEQDIHENIEYNLAGTPCEDVVRGTVTYYPERLKERFPHVTLESYLGMPVYDSSGTILGHLAIADDKPMNREPHDMAILKIFAARAGIELERKRAEEALRESENRLRQLNEQLEDYSRNLEQKVAERTGEIERRRQVAERLRGMLNILNSNRSLDEILDYIVADGIWLLGTGSGAIYRLDTEQARFVVQAYRGLTPEYIENLSFPVDRSFLGLALKSREPVVVADLESALRNQNIGLDAERCKILVRDYRALLAVPLIRQGTLEETDEIYGGIALYFAEPHQFSEEDIGLAVAFADQAALAIENARLRQRVRQAAVMDERNRLARELHDSVTQSLYSLTLMAEGWRRMAETGRLERIVEPLIELGSIGQQALKEMRLLVHELRPPLLAQEGLAGALHQRLGAVEQRAGIEARLLVDDMADRADLPAHVEEGLYRIAQEALNNSLKHAEATSVTVHMQADDAGIELVISDNGKGFDPAFLRNHGGVGLNSMRERARHLGGTLTINTSPGEGTRVRAWVRTTPPPHR